MNHFMMKVKSKKETLTKSSKINKKGVTSSSTLPSTFSSSSERLPVLEDGEIKVTPPSSASPPLPPTPIWKQGYWSLVASLSFLCTGLLRAYTSPALLSMQNDAKGNDRSNSSNPFLSSSSTSTSRNDLISWFASIGPLASFVGTILSGPCLDQLGRRQTLFLLTFPAFLGWILVGTASSISSLLLGRGFTGLASGLASATAPLYISEVCQSGSAERRRRGWLGLLPGILLATGILLGFFLADQFQEWRKLAQVISFFPFLLCVLSWTIPESPTWLEGKEGKEVDEIEFDLEMDQVVPSSSTCQKADPNLSEKTGLIAKQHQSLFYSLILPISILMTLQQFCGGNVLIYYLSEILTKDIAGEENTGPDPAIVHQASLIIGLVQFIGFILAIPLIDHKRGGQRSLLIISAVLMSLAHSVLAFHFHHPLDDSDDQLNDSWSPSMIIRVSSLSALFCSYSIGLGPIPFLFIQIFADKSNALGGTAAVSSGRKSNKLKSYISSIASLVNHLSLFAVVKGFPYLFHMEGYGPSITFWVLAIVCWTAAIFAFYFVPASPPPHAISSLPK